MLDPQVTQLLTNGIDTSCKLAIMLRFADSPTLATTAAEIAARICRDIWSVQQALDELVEDTLIMRTGNRYECPRVPETATALRLLQETYAQPIQRGELQALIRDLEQYAPYRKEFPARLLLQRVA